MPNYSMDDEGLPTSFAPGNTPDIECTDEKGKVLIEVSLISNRSQVTNETIPIERHLLDTIKDFKESFSIFSASFIHSDAHRYVEFSKATKHVIIKPFNITEFIVSISLASILRELSF